MDPAFIEHILDQIVKQKFVRLQFYLKPEIAKEVINFVENIEIEKGKK